MNDVLQHARSAYAGSSLDNRLLRGLLQVRATPDDEDCLANWHALQEHRVEMDEQAQRICAWVTDWHSQFGGRSAPDFELGKEYFEKQDDVETVSRLEEIAREPHARIREGYRSICRSVAEAQEQTAVVRRLHIAARVVTHGQTFERPVVDGRRTIRGVDDARRWLAAELAESAPSALRRTSLRAMDLVVAEDEERPRLSTGIAALDDALGGGLPCGHVHIAVAPPGNFKSSWLTWLAARFASAGHPVVVMSIDEGGRRTHRRLRPLLGGADVPISYSSAESVLETEAQFVAEEAKRLTREAAVTAIRSRPHLPRDVDDDGVIDHVVRRDGLRRTPVLIVDSVQCVRTAKSDRMRDEYTRINEVMLAARAAAEKHDILLVMSSEANRSSYRGRRDDENSTGLSSGKGSSSIEYKADSPMTMKKTVLDDGSVVVRCKLEKNRLGPSEPEWTMAWDGKAFTAVDVELPAPVDDATRVSEIISMSRTPICTTEMLYDACKEAGISKHARVDAALASLKRRGLVTGGRGLPLRVLCAVDVVVDE